MAAPEPRQAGLLHQAQLFGKGGLAEITRVIIGQRDRIEMALQHRQYLRVGTEGKRFEQGIAATCHHAFQIADTQVMRIQQGLERLEGVSAARNQLAGAFGHHDVADEHNGHFTRGRCGMGRRRGQQRGQDKQGEGAFHACILTETRAVCMAQLFPDYSRVMAQA